MATISREKQEKRQLLEKRFDKFLDDANIIYSHYAGGSGEHLFVAHSYYREGEDVVRFALGTADADGFDPKIEIPIDIDSDPMQTYGSIDELVELSEPQFNYWMTRALDYNSTHSAKGNFEWEMKNDIKTESFNMYELCADILTEPERMDAIIDGTNIDKLPYEERVLMGVQLAHSFLEDETYLVPEAYDAMIRGLGQLQINERTEYQGLITDASIEAAEYYLTSFKNTELETFFFNDFAPERLALEAWLTAENRQRYQERTFVEELNKGFDEPEKKPELPNAMDDFNKTYQALKEIQQKAEAVLKEKGLVNKATGEKMYPVCISMTELTAEEIAKANAAFKCAIVLGSNTKENTPSIELLANNNGDQLFDVAARSPQDFEKWLMTTIERENIYPKHDDPVKEMKAPMAEQAEKEELYKESFEILKHSDVARWSYHDKVAFGVMLSKDFVELGKYEDEKELSKFKRAIDVLDLDLEDRKVTKGDFMGATIEGGEFLVYSVMNKDQRGLEFMNKPEFTKWANTWEQADREREKEERIID